MADTRFEHLFTPFTVREMTVRNRIVVPGHATLFMAPDGLPTDRQRDYLLAKARGGVGLIIAHAHSVMSPLLEPLAPVALQQDEFVSAYAPIVDAIHGEGARYLLQLNHSGGMGSPRGSGPVTLGPSAVRAGGAMTPVEMTIEHIERVVEAYRAAARQARDAGFDGVEIMAEVTFLVAQFLSPVYNQRQDEYGGSLENRLRFVLEVIHAVRDGVGPDRVVGIRMAGDQFVEGGLTLAHVLEIVPGLEAGGDLDLLHIGAGPGAAGHIPPSYYRPGSLVYLSEAIRKVTNLPMICSQRINDPLIAEDVLARNVADLVAMNRALMADPELPIKAREGRLEDIRRCIACNECIGRFQDGLPIACTVNPEMGRETRMVITPAEQSRNVMVVGGGPAGLEAARVAALRGHRVRLFERGSQLGGQTLLAARAPLRDEIGQIARYYATQLEKLQVEVHLESEVSVELVEREAPDVVIVATGSKPLQAGIETFEGAHVVDARDVLDGEITLGHRIAVVCREQHNQALSVADFLADRGHEVELITADLHAGVTLEGGTRNRIYHRLLTQNVRITPLVNVNAVRGKTLEATCAITQAERAFDDFDSVVLAFGGEPDGTLGYALERNGYEIHVIGDALSPRRIIDATLEGAQAGHAI